MPCVLRGKHIPRKECASQAVIAGNEDGRLIEFDCPYCGKRFGVSEEHAGRAGKCPSCHSSIEVPAPNGSGRFDDLSAEQRVELLLRGIRDISLRYREQREQFRILHEKAKVLHNTATKALQKNQELRLAKAQLGEAQAMLAALRQDLTQTSQALGTAIEQRDRFADEVNELRQEMERLENLAAGSETARIEAARAKELEAEVARLREHVSDVRLASGAEVDQRIAALREELEALHSERDVLLFRIEAAETGRVQMDAACRQADTAMQDIRDELGKMHEFEGRCAALETERLALREEMRETAAAAQRIQAELQETIKALGAAEAQADEYRRARDRAAEENDMLRASLTAIEERFREVEYRAGKADVFEQERNTAQRLCREMEAQLAQLREGWGQLALNSDQAAAQAAQALLDAQQAAERLANEKACRDQTESELARAVEARDALQARLDETRSRLSLLEEAERDARDASARFRESQAHVERLTIELAQSAQALGSAEAKADIATRELEKKQADADELRARLDAALAEQTFPWRNRTARSEEQAPSEKETEDWEMEAVPEDMEKELEFVPEVLDDEAPLSDEMMRTLLRFIAPEEEKR